MNNAAIIIFRRSTLPKILNFFAKPRLKQIIEAGDTKDKVSVYIIECPTMNEPKDNRKAARFLKKLCTENNISFFVGNNTEYYIGSGMEQIESSMERGCAKEAEAIKGLAALIKLSAEKSINLLNKNFCFIAESYSHQYISIMSEEAAGVYIYENEKMDSNEKKLIFETLMEEKGVSAVFTKSLDRGISQSDIIIADNSVCLDEYRQLLTGKVLIGNSTADGDFRKISRVLLWYEGLARFTEDVAAVRFNDELLAILRHFYRERDTIDFIRRFPYIYLFGKQDSGI